MSKSAVLAAALLLVVAGCGDAAGGDGDGVSVVATTTILGDVAREVVGDGGTVEVLLPLGVDPHDYQASSQQVAALLGADLVVANGLGLEEGLSGVLEAAAGDGANVLEVAPALDPLPFPGGAPDPHVWMDPIRMVDAVALIATELEAVDPDGGWGARAEAYGAELRAADARIREILGDIPAANRELVTNHESLGYFANRYDFVVVGVVIPGGSTLADPSSADLADLVAAIEDAGVPAIFAETTEPVALAEAVAAEAGSGVAVVELFSGSLGEAGSGAETLVDMLVTDARLIAAALS